MLAPNKETTASTSFVEKVYHLWERKGFQTLMSFTRLATPLYIDLVVKNAEFVPLAGPMIVVANHESGLETVILPSILNKYFKKMRSGHGPQNLYSVGRDTLVDSLAQASFVEKLSRFSVEPMEFATTFYAGIGAILITRGQITKSQAKQILATLSDGKVLIMYPEGTRGQGVHNFFYSAGLWAWKKNVPIVPVTINYSAMAQEKILGNKLPYPLNTRSPLELCFHRPVSVPSREDVVEVMASIQKTIADAYIPYGDAS